MSRVASPQMVLAGFYPPPLGGESVHVGELSARLRERGMLKVVLNLRRGAPRSSEYVVAARPPRLWLKLMRALTPGTMLHLHTNGHSWRSWVVIACAAVALRARRRSGVLTLHSGMCPSFLRSIDSVGLALVRLALAPFGHIVCVNDEIRAALAELGVRSERLSVIPAFLGVSSGRLSGEDERLLDGTRPLLSVVAGAGVEYGLEVFIGAAARLRDTYAGLRCVILGTDGAGVPATMVRAFGLVGHVRFLGSVPHHRCLGFVARSDVFVRPSLADGDAVSVREALSLGVPVVASDVVSRPVGSILFRGGDGRDLADKIAMLLRGDRAPSPGPAPDVEEAILSVYQKAMGQRC